MTTEAERPKGNGRNGKTKTVENLGSLLENGSSEERGHRFEQKSLAFDQINILPQVRKTFKDIDLLADNIYENGLMELPIIVVYDEPHAQKHLDTINELEGTELNLDHLTAAIGEDGTRIYNVLLAGERRVRACKKLREEGRYEEVFGGDEIDVRYRTNINPVKAIFIQLSENTQDSVPAHEEAEKHDEMFRFLRLQIPDYPLARYAKQVGRSEGKIRESLRFCMLPEQIKDYVKDGLISYGIGVEIARLAQADADVNDMEFYAVKALTGRLRVDDFKDVIDSYFNNRKGNMFEIFQDEQLGVSKRAAHRKVVKKELIMALWSWIHYFKHVKGLFESGQLGEEDSPFSDGSPRRLYTQAVSLFVDLAPLFKGVMTKNEFARVSEQINILSHESAKLPEYKPSMLEEGMDLYLPQEN